MSVEVVRTIRAVGGDFTNVSSWMNSYAPNGSFLNLTEPAIPTRVYAFTGTDQLLANEVVTSQTGATGTVRGSVKDGLIVIRAQFNAFSSGDVLTSASGSITLSSGGAAAILVCEFYGDWPNGLVDSIRLRIFGNAWTYPVFRVEDSARHKGRHRTTPGLFYLAPSSGAGFVDLSFAKGYAELYDIAVAGQADGFIVDSNKYMVNPLVYEAVNGVASFANIAPRSVIINGQTTAATPIGYQLAPGSGTQTYLLNCSDWNSLTSFSVSDIIGSTDANLINCAGLSANASLACFIGGFTNTNNTNNASRDGSAPGLAASFNVSPLLEDPVTLFKHLSYDDTDLNDRGANLTTHPLYPFTFDYDYELRPDLSSWAIGPDQVLTNPNVVAHGGTTLESVTGYGLIWTEVHGGGGMTLLSAVTGDGDMYIDEALGAGGGHTPMIASSSYPFGTALRVSGGGNANIVGHGQGFATLRAVLGRGAGHVEPMGSGGGILEAVYGGYVAGQGGLKLRTNVIGGGAAGYEIYSVTDNGLFGAMQYREDFEPKLEASNYAGGNVWEASEHWLPIPIQYREAILAYISYKILLQSGKNSTYGNADFFLRRYEHACRILETEGTTTTISNTQDVLTRTDSNKW